MNDRGKIATGLVIFVGPHGPLQGEWPQVVLVGIIRIRLELEKRNCREIFGIRYRRRNESISEVVERLAFGFPFGLSRGPSTRAAPVFLDVKEDDEGDRPEDEFEETPRPKEATDFCAVRVKKAFMGFVFGAVRIDPVKARRVGFRLELRQDKRAGWDRSGRAVPFPKDRPGCWP